VSRLRKINLDMTVTTQSKDASRKKPLSRRKPSMSSGEKFLKRKTNDVKEISIPCSTLAGLVSSWLYATRAIDEAKNISDITFLLKEGSDKVDLRIYIGGKQD